MADTSQSEQPSQASEPQTNGLPDGVEEDEKTKMRPADIDADMREMERRKRVEMIMNSRLFREELERIIESQLKDGNGPAGLLQQISDMMGMQGGRLQSGNVFRSASCVVPINDIRGVESMGYAKGEKILRCKLAAVYRLMDLYGWSQGVYNHITARLNQDQEHFLVNPFGMLYHEITASSLVKIDMQGNIVEAGTTNFGVNVTGFLLHAAIHAARPDIKCIIHVHTPSVLAVSSLKCGLLPLCQEAVVVGEISQHPYLGGLAEPEEREKIARNLGPLNKVMFLTNHGVVCCGETVEEAFFNVYNTVLACETQIKLMPMGVDNLVLVSDEARKQIYEAARRPPDSATKQPDPADLPPSGIKKEKQWRVGGVEFEALMRMLDNAGFRTGYIYRHPLVKGEPPRPRNDVEVPPAVSSLGYLLEEEEMYKQGHWKKYADGRKTHDRTRWLNSPNVYQKVEILETGTPDPKKITKWVDANAEEWVAEGSPTHSSTPVRIEGALQFVPKNTDPREFKKLQQQIKDNRRSDKITSGPQSHILEGVSWEEAKKLQDANISATGDQVILVGAASKGIIQRGFQHNALVYKTPYAKNPFDTITDEELEEYKKVVERKQRGESFDEEQSESEPLSSSLHNSRPTNEESASAAKSPLLSPTSAASETEEESRDEPRVLRIETKQVPRPSQAEVVLSDAEGELPDPGVERTMSLRYPSKAPDSPADSDQFKRTWSLPPDQLKKKDNNEKYVEDKCDQLQQDLKINACNHHLPCCSYNNLTHTHKCLCSCFPPLGYLPQAAKKACVTSYSFLSSISSIISGSHQKRERCHDNVIGCRITRFANIPHLQRREIEDSFYFSQNKKVAKNFPRSFSKPLSRNILDKTYHSNFGAVDDNILNRDYHLCLGSHFKFVDNTVSQYSDESHQKNSSFSLQKCSLLPSNLISRCLDRASSTMNNIEIDIKNERNVFDLKYENVQLLTEKKCNLKNLSKAPNKCSVNIEMNENIKFNIKGAPSFFNVTDKVKNNVFEIENCNTDVYKEKRKTVVDDAFESSILDCCIYQNGSWPKSETPSISSTKNTKNLFCELDPYIAKDFKSVSIVRPIAHDCEIIHTTKNDNISQSKMENSADNSEVTIKANAGDSDRIVFSLVNIKNRNDKATRETSLEKERNLKLANDDFLHVVQSTENEINSGYIISSKRIQNSSITDIVVSVDNNLLDSGLQREQELSECSSGSENICFSTESCCGGKKQKIKHTRKDFLETMTKCSLKMTSDAHSLKSEEINNGNAQNDNEDIMDMQLELNKLFQVCEKESDLNKSSERSRSLVIEGNNTNFSGQICNLYEENNSNVFLSNDNVTEPFENYKVFKEYSEFNVKSRTVLEDTPEKKCEFVLPGYEKSTKEIGIGNSSNAKIINFYEENDCDYKEDTLTCGQSENLFAENAEYHSAENFDHNNNHNTNYIENVNENDGTAIIKDKCRKPCDHTYDMNYICHVDTQNVTRLADDTSSSSSAPFSANTFLENFPYNKKANSYYTRSININENIVFENKHDCGIQAIGFGKNKKNISVELCGKFENDINQETTETCFVNSVQNFNILIVSDQICDTIDVFHNFQKWPVNDGKDRKVTIDRIETVGQNKKKSVSNNLKEIKLSNENQAFTSFDYRQIYSSKFLNDKIIQDFNFNEIHAQCTPEIFNRTQCKHFHFIEKSLKTFSDMINECKFVGKGNVHNIISRLLENNVSYNFTRYLTCAAFDNAALTEGIIIQHVEVNNLKSKENVCSLFGLLGDTISPGQIRKTRDSNYTPLLNVCVANWCAESKKYFSDTSMIKGSFVSLKKQSNSQLYREPYILRNSPLEEISLFSDNDVPYVFANLISDKHDLLLTDKRDKVLQFEFPFLCTISLGSSCKSFSARIEKILRSCDLEIDVHTCLNDVSWERDKAVVPYNEGLYEKIIVHCNFKTKPLWRENSKTCMIQREELETLRSLGENLKSWNDYTSLKFNIMEVKLLPSFIVSQRVYESNSLLPLIVNSTLPNKAALCQLESYFKNNLYDTGVANEPNEPQVNDERRYWPADFDNETPSVATDFTDTEGTLLASCTKCKDSDSASSPSSTNSSNCSSKFSSTIPSDLSLSTSSLDIVTALTEVPSLSIENPSLDYYSFSSPVLDMEDPEFSLSDIQESNVASFLTESQSFNLSSDTSFTTHDLDLSNTISQSRSVNSQKSEVGLNPYLKICFSSSESLSCNNLSNDSKNLCNFCGNNPFEYSAVDEMNISATQPFTPNMTQTSNSNENSTPELTSTSCSFICSDCKNKINQNKSYCECVSSDSICTQCLTSEYQCSTDPRGYDSCSSNTPDHSLDRQYEPMQGECKIAFSFHQKHLGSGTEDQKLMSACGNISLQIKLDCSADQDEECHLVSIKKCVGYKPQAQRRKNVHRNVGVGRKVRKSKNPPQKLFNSRRRDFQEEYQYKNNCGNKFYQKTTQQIGIADRSLKNPIRQTIVKSKSCQDVSFNEKVNENLFCEVEENSVDGGMCTAYRDYMCDRGRSFAYTKGKSYSYQNILHERNVDEEFLKKRTPRRRTIDTFFIDGEHIFAVLTPEQGLSPEKRSNEASGLPKILSDYSDNEISAVAPPVDLSSSNFTEYIDSLDYSPVTQPDSCLSDISSLSSLPLDRVPISDVDSPAVPERQASANSTS